MAEDAGARIFGIEHLRAAQRRRAERRRAEQPKARRPTIDEILGQSLPPFDGDAA